MDTDHTNSKRRHCEERSDVAISCYGISCTIEIATLPSVARDDAALRHSLSAQDDHLRCLEQLAFKTASGRTPTTESKELFDFRSEYA